MKIQIPKDDLKNRRPPPPISYKPDPNIGNNPAENLDSLKVNIKTKPGERDSKMVAIYMLLFCIGSPDAPLKFFTLLNKII